MDRKIKLPEPLFVENGEKAVVLFHAYAGSSNDVRMLARHLERSGYTVYTPIFSGHATLSPEDILDQTIAHWRQDAQQAITFLRDRGYQKIAVFGLSMGGLFAMKLLTEKQPGIIGGGCFCSPLFPVKNQVTENFVRYALAVLQLTEISEPLIDQRMVAIKKRAAQQLQHIENYGQEITNDLNDITVPVFIAQAGKDEMIDATGAFQTVKALTNTHVTFQWYPNSGHVLTVDAAHQQLEQEVTNYLETLHWDKEK